MKEAISTGQQIKPTEWEKLSDEKKAEFDEFASQKNKECVKWTKGSASLEKWKRKSFNYGGKVLA